MYNTRRVMEECLAIKPDLDLPVGRGLVRLRALVALPAPAHGDGRRGRHRGRGCATRPRSRPTRRQQAELGKNAVRRRRCWRRGSSPIRARCGCGSTRPTRPTSRCRRIRQGSMVLVQGRRLRARREPVPRGGLHPRLDQPQPAADRQPRRRAPADGAGGLRPRDERDRDRAQDPRAR